MSLRVADITDLGVAKQVATLALAENERLYARLEALTKQLAVLSGAKAPEQLELELLRIREQMMALQRRTFAASSEKRPREGGDSKSRPEPPTGVREHRKLPLVECVHELAPGARCCASCGREMVQWDGQHEDTEEVDVVRREFVLKKHRRTFELLSTCAVDACVTSVKDLPGAPRPWAEARSRQTRPEPGPAVDVTARVDAVQARTGSAAEQALPGL